MEFREILAQRRMHRAFLPEPLPEDQVDRIANVIRHAPSGGFSQGSSIVVITDADLRGRIAEAFGGEHYSTNGRNFIADAPVHMVISANEALYHARYNEADKLAATGGVEITWPVPYWHVDAGASMMLLMLAAVDEGLAAGVFGVLDWQPIWELLGIPDDVLPVAVVTVGKPAPETRERSSRKRGWKPLDDVVRWERW